MRRAIALSLLARLAASQSLTEAIAGQDGLSGLETALGLVPELVETLNGLTNITILAPNTQALAGIDLGNVADIPNILTYHVVSGLFRSTDFSETPVFAATLLTDSSATNVTGGQVVKIEVEDDGVVEINDDADVVTPDIEFTGGIIHIIDEVLEIPGSVVDALTQAGLSSLADAATTAGLVDALSNTADLTIFAPTNEAFDAISDVTANLTTEQLADVLRYHVIAGTVGYSSGLSTTQLETLQGSNVNITVSDDDITVNNAQVTTADVLVANGVVHVIDAVLIPATDGGNGDNGDNGDNGGTASPTPTPTTVSNAPSSMPSRLVTLAAGLMTFAMVITRL